jgi:mannose-6-phosphate isomerase-like protein (cupin superfamily)
MRRHISTSLLIVGLVCDRAAAQQPDTTGTPAVTRAAAVTPRARAAARREAENRRRRVDFIDAKTLSVTAAGLDRRPVVGTTVLTSSDEQTTYLLVRRTTSSKPEVHARWDDLVIVRSGAGAIEMGDSLVGSRYRAPGERIGGKFTRSFQIVVHAGDIVRIPAAVPHAFVVSGAEALEYLVIKQRRQELPIRWFGER